MWFISMMGYLLLTYLVGFIVWRGVWEEYEPRVMVQLLLFSSVGAWVFGKLLGIGWVLLSGNLVVTELFQVRVDMLGVILGGYGVLAFFNIYWNRKRWSDVLDYWWAAFLLGSVGYSLRFIFVPGHRFTGIVLITLFLLAYGFHWFILKRYRRFIWYQSGKVGFAYWAGVIVFVLGWAIWSAYWGHGWVMIIQIVMAVMVECWALTLLYQLSGRKWKHDFPWMVRVFDAL